jgi:hypothetical protein
MRLVNIMNFSQIHNDWCKNNNILEASIMASYHLKEGCNMGLDDRQVGRMDDFPGNKVVNLAHC